MSHFKRVALLKAHQKLEPPADVYSSDLVELAYLGAYIQNDVEYVTIPVSPYDKNPFKVFEKSLKRDNFDLVGISSMTGGYNAAREFANLARQAGTYVVMGGYHPTALTDEVLADPNVDAVIRGEGDNPFRDLILNGPNRDVLGLSYKVKGEPIHNGDQDLIEDLDTLPQPLRSIRPMRFGEKGDAYTIDTLYSSRGCIAKCTFCANDTVNKEWRPRSPEHFIEELKQIHSKHIRRTVKFFDSIFLFDAKRVERILELMFKHNLTNFKIITESRSDDVIRCAHLMKDMKRIGFDKVQIGIETPDPETFKTLRKGGSVQKHEKAIRIVQEAGLKVEGFLIIGHPHETKEDILRYPEFAKQMGLDHRALYFVMTPYPGTQIYREYDKRKLIDSLDWDCYNNFGTVVHLENMERAELRNLLSYCYGSTSGIPFIFEKHKGVPTMIGHLLFVTIIWLYLYDIQGENRKQSRNDFIWSFYQTGLGKFQKIRKMKARMKFTMWFVKSFNFCLKVDEERSLVFKFKMEKDQIHMDVQNRSQNGTHMITVTMDDLDALHQALDMSDINNCAMIQLLKHAPWSNRLTQCRYCLPVLIRAFAEIGKIVWSVVRRYFSSVNEPAITIGAKNNDPSRLN
jgi:radical SAM superfamily enzyme YgiQ (UPF0313 family)